MTRTEIVVNRAVELIGIGSDDPRRAECVTAVKVALLMAGGSAKDMQRHSQRRGKPGKRAGAVLQRGLQYVLQAIKDQNLSLDQRQIVSFIPPPDDLARAIKLVNKARIKTGERYHYEAEKKRAAMREAKNLLDRFNKRVAATKGSTFCKLTALLYGEPEADLRDPCRRFLENLRS